MQMNRAAVAKTRMRKHWLVQTAITKQRELKKSESITFSVAQQDGLIVQWLFKLDIVNLLVIGCVIKMKYDFVARAQNYTRTAVIHPEGAPTRIHEVDSDFKF